MTTGMQKLNERGVAAAEFALLLPVLLTILFGTIEFGMMMYGREVVTNATREGARAGIVQGPPKRTMGDIKTIANNYINDELGTGTGINLADVDFDPENKTINGLNMLIVKATYRYHFLIPYIPSLLNISNPLIITTQVVMRHE